MKILYFIYICFQNDGDIPKDVPNKKASKVNRKSNVLKNTDSNALPSEMTKTKKRRQKLKAERCITISANDITGNDTMLLDETKPKKKVIKSKKKKSIESQTDSEIEKITTKKRKCIKNQKGPLEKKTKLTHIDEQKTKQPKHLQKWKITDIENVKEDQSEGKNSINVYLLSTAIVIIC